MTRSTTPQKSPDQPAQTIPTRFIGCDVGKSSIAVCDSRDGSVRTLANAKETLEVFMGSLDDTCLIVCEAAGNPATRSATACKPSFCCAAISSISGSPSPIERARRAPRQSPAISTRCSPVSTRRSPPSIKRSRN